MSPERLDALELARDLEPTPKNIQRLSAQVGEEAARWAFTQWELRKRARAKFALADQMLFDRDGLEMATHERVAAYHASHFPEGETVADLSCGIGGDLIALAKRGPVVGYETDPLRAEYARHNLKVHGLEGVVKVGTGETEFMSYDSIFVDPQRRGRQGYGQPDPQQLKDRESDLGSIIVKLGTGFDMKDIQENLFPCVEAVSYGGECRELLSKSSGKPGIYAFHVETLSRVRQFGKITSVAKPSSFFFHADPALIKADAFGEFEDTFRFVFMLGDSNGYLTSQSPIFSQWWRTYRTIYHGSGDRKTTQAALSELRAVISEVKTRGVDQTADAIRAQFKPAGSRRLTLAVWPVGKSLQHTLIEPIDPKEYRLNPPPPKDAGETDRPL